MSQVGRLGTDPAQIEPKGLVWFCLPGGALQEKSKKLSMTYLDVRKISGR